MSPTSAFLGPFGSFRSLSARREAHRSLSKPHPFPVLCLGDSDRSRISAPLRGFYPPRDHHFYPVTARRLTVALRPIPAHSPLPAYLRFACHGSTFPSSPRFASARCSLQPLGTTLRMPQFLFQVNEKLRFRVCFPLILLAFVFNRLGLQFCENPVNKTTGGLFVCGSGSGACGRRTRSFPPKPRTPPTRPDRAPATPAPPATRFP